jgi:hypothetical protein
MMRNQRCATWHPPLRSSRYCFDGQGDGVVAKGKDGLRYEPGEQRVYINATQYFAPVPADVFSYQVGGYQVCEKWLKDRRERHLEIDDIRTYCRIWQPSPARTNVVVSVSAAGVS